MFTLQITTISKLDILKTISDLTQKVLYQIYIFSTNQLFHEAINLTICVWYILDT
jgi:hypothetical protein